MLRPALAIALALLAAPVLAGCLNPAANVTPASTNLDTLMASPTSLWPDHENEPHPMFNWPTLTHPAVSNGTIPLWWKPVPNTTVPANIQGLEHVAKAPDAVTGGAGIAVFGSLALVPSDGPNAWVLDIRDPTHPQVLSQYPGGGERGAAIMAFPDGRLYGVVSTTPGFDVVNLTDPHNASIVAQVKAPRAGHKLGIVPGTPYVYNANSKGGDGDPLFGTTGDLQGVGDKGETEIYNLMDPEHPLLVQEFKNGYGCHHIFFWIDASQNKERAICAGIEYTQIWDIKDPAKPSVIVSVPVHHGNPALPATSVPPVMFSHFSILNQDGTELIVGDEFMGGATAECDGIHTPVKDTSGPLGNVWFYDVKDEKNPKLLGFFSPPPKMISNPDVTAGCTAHHGRLVPDPSGKRQLLAIAWYADGTVLIDFTDATNPKMVDMWNQGTNTWESWYDNGWIFTGDLNRGFDVLKLK